MIYISEHARAELTEYLASKDNITVVKETDLVYKEVSAHPDIYMCSLGSKVIHATPEELGYEYPLNCSFNAACTGKYLIGNMRHLSPRLLAEAGEMIKIDVKQGYTKCNTVVVDEDSVITSDRGIAAACEKYMDVLLISESSKDKPYIKLKGFPYGFIGGTCGRIFDEIVFNGRLSDHPDCRKIISFIKERNLTVREFDWELEDIGSIIQ